MTRRFVAITVAIVLAALGTVGGVYLVVTADSRARNAVNEVTTVLVATQEIRAGTPGSEVAKYVKAETWPVSKAPSDTMSEVPAELQKMVLTTTIPKGWFVTSGVFDTKPVASTGGLTMPQGMVAITIQTASNDLVSTFVQPRSQVAVYLTTNGDKARVTKVLLERAEVIAVGAQTASNPSGKRSGAVTLAVKPNDDLLVYQAMSMGTLNIGLLTDSVTLTRGATVNNQDIP
jgi:Flp pilus assembly protein CpaB